MDGDRFDDREEDSFGSEAEEEGTVLPEGRGHSV
jgi:hypothetical protein